MKRLRGAIAIAVSFGVFGCGGGFATGRPWNAEAEASVFDDGVDLVDDPAKLSGEWETAAQMALQHRASSADMTAIVDISSIQTTKDVDGTEARRISVDLVELLYGATPEKTITFESAATALGNSLIVRHEQRLDGAFIVFVRWFDRPDGTVGSHFHFSPSSPADQALVRAEIAERTKRETASKQR